MGDPRRGRRVAFLAAQPTQFDAPFFRFAHATGTAAITVMYLRCDPADPELAHKLDWGIDLFSGYDHVAVPAGGRVRWLRGELRPEKYDWLILNGYTTRPYLAALLIARMRGIRTGLRIDSVLFNAAGVGRRARKRVILSVLDKLFERFFAVGTLAREYLEHFGIAGSKISLFPYLVDAGRFSPAPGDAARSAMRARFGLPPGARVVLAVAKMNAREAPWDLVDALAGLAAPDVWTVLVGAGDQLEAVRASVASKGVERVAFAGYVPYPELGDFYAMADVFVHAAADEPWGVSVHEAIASGLPVIASSRVGAGRDLIVEGRNGFVYEHGHPDQLRRCIADALDRLDPRAVREENSRLLEQWGHARTWSAMLEALR